MTLHSRFLSLLVFSCAALAQAGQRSAPRLMPISVPGMTVVGATNLSAPAGVPNSAWASRILTRAWVGAISNAGLGVPLISTRASVCRI